MNLNLVVHGRTASTLIARMLIDTGEFTTWEPELERGLESNEFRSFVSGNLNWDKEKIREFINGKGFTGDVLVKEPRLGFCIDKFLFLNPSVLVIQRSPFEKLRSLIKLEGWEQTAWDGYIKHSILDAAKEEYYEKGGRYKDLNQRCEVFLVQVYGNWYTEYHLNQYNGKKLFIYFDDIVMRPRDVYCLLDEFYGFKPMKYWEGWSGIGKLQATWRKTAIVDGVKTLPPEGFSKPYSIDLDENREVFADMVCVFENR